MTNEIITLETVQQNALEVFTGKSDALDILLKKIETEALSLVPDVTTKKGRDAIASNAYKVAQSKSRIEKEGKALADKQKEIPKLIDASRKKAKTFLDDLQDRVRAPLTEYEQAEAKKEAERIAKIKAEQEAAEAERLYLLLWDEALVMNDRFDIDKEKAAIEAKKRAERETKEQAEREERIKQQAIAEQEAKHQAAIEQAEREKQAAQQAEQLAIENARLEKERSEQREKEALERAEREKQQAVEQEKARAKAEADRLQAIEDKRKADIAHRTAVKTAVKTALITKCGLSEQQAIDVVKAAIEEKLANLKIHF
jgi:hypothetical protein